MAAFTLKNIPDDLLVRVRARAAQHGRSVNREMLMMLERELARSEAADPAMVRERLKRTRDSLPPAFLLTDAMIAPARARRRGRG